MDIEQEPSIELDTELSTERQATSKPNEADLSSPDQEWDGRYYLFSESGFRGAFTWRQQALAFGVSVATWIAITEHARLWPILVFAPLMSWWILCSAFGRDARPQKILFGMLTVIVAGLSVAPILFQLGSSLLLAAYSVLGFVLVATVWDAVRYVRISRDDYDRRAFLGGSLFLACAVVWASNLAGVTLIHESEAGWAAVAILLWLLFSEIEHLWQTALPKSLEHHWLQRPGFIIGFATRSMLGRARTDLRLVGKALLYWTTGHWPLVATASLLRICYLALFGFTESYLNLERPDKWLFVVILCPIALGTLCVHRMLGFEMSLLSPLSEKRQGVDRVTEWKDAFADSAAAFSLGVLVFVLLPGTIVYAGRGVFLGPLLWIGWGMAFLLWVLSKVWKNPNVDPDSSSRSVDPSINVQPSENRGSDLESSTT